MVVDTRKPVFFRFHGEQGGIGVDLLVNFCPELLPVVGVFIGNIPVQVGEERDVTVKIQGIHFHRETSNIFPGHTQKAGKGKGNLFTVWSFPDKRPC